MKKFIFTVILLFSYFGFVESAFAACNGKDKEWTNSNLQNHQSIDVKGGPCGGNVTIKATFSGNAQFFNHGSPGDPKRGFASISIESSEGNQCYKSDPTNDSATSFNTFSLTCEMNNGVPPNGVINYRVDYKTNNVSDQPLPSLNVSYEFISK